MEHKIQYINVLRLLKIESLVIKKLQYKLNNQMRHLREFKNLKRIQSICFKLIEESKLQIKSNEPNYQILQDMIQQIIDLTQTNANLIRTQLRRKFLIQFQVLTFASLSRINYNAQQLLEILVKINE